MSKIAICDDENDVCSVLEEHVMQYYRENFESCEIEIWNDSTTICQQIEAFNPDILFLDIELPSNNGVYVGKYIRDVLKNEIMDIVFISHNTSYAMELFQLHPFDFLVKPIDKEWLFSTLSRIDELETVKKKKFHYTYKQTNYYVPYVDILYFMSTNKTVNIYLANGEIRVYNGKLRDIIESLPWGFVCIGKSYIINMRYLSSWKSGWVTMENGTALPISQSRRESFKKAFYNYVQGTVC